MTEIRQPRRILLLCQPEAAIAPILTTLVPPPSSEKPDASEEIEPIHHIKTPYYSAKVPIWTDSIEDAASWSEEWKNQDGAADVVSAVGAWIVAFTKPATQKDLVAIKSLLSSVAAVLSHHDSSSTFSSESLQIAVALPQSLTGSVTLSSQEWDDICRETGNWEFIDSSGDGSLNEYGEQTGLPRLLTSLQTGEWDSPAVDGFPTSDEDGDSDLDAALDSADADLDADAGRAFDPTDAAATRQGRAPILGGGRKDGDIMDGMGDEDEDEDVEALQRMLIKMQAAKELGVDVGPAERRRLAREAVRGIMKEI